MPCFQIIREDQEQFIEAQHAAEAWHRTLNQDPDSQVSRDCIVELRIVNRERCETAEEK